MVVARRPAPSAGTEPDALSQREVRQAARKEARAAQDDAKTNGQRKGQSRQTVTAEMIRRQLRLHDRDKRARENRRRQEQILERGFRRRNVATLKEGQDALNIAFGAVLSAYIGNVLAGLNPAKFSQSELAWFFVLIGIFITGLCVGNSGLLKGHRGLSALFMAGSLIAAYLALHVARMLGFETPILRVMMICWVLALLAGDLVLTAIIYLHHKRSTA